jgi:anti-sigma factor RsiW
MNTSRDSLSEALRSWRVMPPSDPNFRTAVWERMRKRPEVSWPAYLRSHAMAWSTLAALALLVAGYSGSALARAHVRADREAIATTYLVDLDPRVQAALKP